MKRTVAIAMLAVLVMAVVATTAFAAGPIAWGRYQTTPPAAQNETFTCPMGGPGMMGGTMRGGMMGGAMIGGQLDAVTGLLGMTAEEIQAERQAGKSLAQIANAKGINTETLVDTILLAKKEFLATAVADGKLTQEQADAMFAHMQTQVKVMVERTGTGPMMGRGQGMRGGMGQGMGQGMRGGMRGWQQQDRSY